MCDVTLSYELTFTLVVRVCSCDMIYFLNFSVDFHIFISMKIKPENVFLFAQTTRCCIFGIMNPFDKAGGPKSIRITSS